GASSGGEH
ncbi:hypothetical protein ECEC1869_1738, partial [Escherichia coli EC1869]